MTLDWPGGSWQETLQWVITILAIYGSVIWLALVFWVFRDIRQRTRDPLMQVVSVALVLAFFLPGHWVYLILRPRYTLTELYERSLEEEAILQDLDDERACPACRRRVGNDFLLCPACLTQLREPCKGCGKPLDYGWMACPFCTRQKPRREVDPMPIPEPGRAQQLAGQLVRRSASLLRNRQGLTRTSNDDEGGGESDSGNGSGGNGGSGGKQPNQHGIVRRRETPGTPKATATVLPKEDDGEESRRSGKSRRAAR